MATTNLGAGAGRFGRSGAGARPVGMTRTETRPALVTTEFYAYVVMTAAVLIAGLVTKAGDGHDDRLTAYNTWLIAGLLTIGYMISRGLAKAGSTDPAMVVERDDAGPGRRD
jgi:hypothetical protein